MRLSLNITNLNDLHTAGRTFYPTKQAVDFIRRLSKSALNGGGAFALEGPYGIGKSSLIAFALNQLACTTSSFSPYLHPTLFEGEDDPVRMMREAGGLAPLVLMGSTDSLVSRISNAIALFVEKEFGLQELHRFEHIDSHLKYESDAERIVTSLVRLERLVAKKRRAGLIIVIDEFGRHLDQMLEPSGSSDLHLLQQIAETTGLQDTSITLVIIQHFGLDHYSSKLLGDKRSEWEKVRGRFIETVLSNSETDTAYIISGVLKTLPKYFETSLKPISSIAATAGSSLFTDAEFIQAATQCRPLHPMTIVLLARLTRILGQEERTVVGWITSELPSGFLTVRSNHRRRWVYPEALFDYFFGDFSYIPNNPMYARRIAAIQGATERINDDLSNDALTLFKVMSMLSFCSGQGLNADKQCAASCLPARFPFDSSVKELLSNSLLVYRSFRSEYIVWEGSDYDILGRIETEMSVLSLNLANEMNRRVSFDVLAHRHFILTGNRRTSRLHWLNSQQLPSPNTGPPRILLWLGQKPKDSPNSLNDLQLEVPRGNLESHLKALVAIENLLAGDVDLQDDLVAIKEMRNRLDHHELAVKAFAEQILLATDLDWRLNSATFNSLQPALTEAMDLAYPASFLLHIDMLNRDKVSGPISLAIRKLIEALFAHEAQENIGIDRFPAERIIYETLLKRNGLHVMHPDGKWGLRAKGDELPIGLQSVIAEIRRHFRIEDRPTSVETVVEALSYKPYGVRRYPTLLLCVVILLSERDKHELYEEGRYLPHWGPQTITRMIKSPKRFSILAAVSAPVSDSFMSSYREALTGGEKPTDGLTPVAVARAALREFSLLSKYSHQTASVSEIASAFRRAIRVAKSPGDMLFRSIPKALGYQTLPLASSELVDFFEKIREARQSLENADMRLLHRLSQVLLSITSSDALPVARRKCVKYAENVLNDSHMYHGYESFVKAVLMNSGSTDDDWFRVVIDSGLGITVPLTSWTDAHVTQAEFLLRQTLVFIQEADHLLSGFIQSNSDSPFAVFVPNYSKEDHKSIEKEIISILKTIPKDSRMPLLINLASKFKD